MTSNKALEHSENCTDDHSPEPVWLIGKILSGGQTGADRAALDWSLRNRIPHGGWCPKGRVAADGPLPLRYQLTETVSSGYRQRTKLNVKDSDTTLVFNTGELDGETLQTVRFAERLQKPHLVIQLDKLGLNEATSAVSTWLAVEQFSTLNVAGPREEKRPGIYELVLSTLNKCLAINAGNPGLHHQRGRSL